MYQTAWKIHLAKYNQKERLILGSKTFLVKTWIKLLLSTSIFVGVINLVSFKSKLPPTLDARKEITKDRFHTVSLTFIKHKPCRLIAG